MRLFRTHREVQRATFRTIVLLFKAMFIVLVGFAIVLIGHYVLGWW